MNKDLKSLQRLIQDLAVRSASLPSPRLSLDYGSRWSRSACVWEESFPSRSAAIRGAERAFSPVYSQAHQRLQDYMEPHAPNSLPAGAQMWLDHHLGEVRQALVPLRTQHTAPVLNRMNALLVADQVLKEWSETNVSLSRRYQLEPPGHYLSRAEFVSYDPSDGEDGLTWLLGKAFIRHGYNLLPAISALEADLRRKTGDYKQAFLTQSERSLHRHILEPMQALMPMLHQILYG